MPLVNIKLVGKLGLNKDISTHELPLSDIAWTDAYNIRFLDGSAYKAFGWGEVYNSPSYVPQHVLPVNIMTNRYWAYATATKQFVVISTAGVVTHTDITHLTARAGVVNSWTSTLLSGLPVLNADDGKVPMYWDLDLAHKFVDIPSFGTFATSCKSMRAYKNFLVALNITKASGNKPFLVKWSNPAEPGSMPTSWDETDTTKEAGESDLDGAETPIVDGLKLRDSFIIYTQNSTHRMDYTGGDGVFAFKKIFGMSGIYNKNCAVEFDGWHFVVTDSDVIIHDGQASTSVLDKKMRRSFFQSLDIIDKTKVFVFKNPFLNEIFIAYPSIGSTTCDMALVYNYVDKTVSLRQIPNLNHANYGAVANDLAGTWALDNDAWDSDLSSWNGPDYTPDTVRVLMASQDQKLYMLDALASFNGVIPTSYLERRGLSFDMPEAIKLIRGIRARIYGNNGDTVIIKVGYALNPYDEPTYTSATHVIGSTISSDLFVSGRYISIRFESGTAIQYRIDSFDIDVETMGAW